jgi:signal transduction histidine kinase
VTIYAERVLQQAYASIRGHRRAADGLLAILLFACSAGQLLMLTPATTAAAAAGVSLLLAAAVAVRRRDPVLAFAVAAVIGAAQAVLGFAPAGNPPVRALQPTVTDLAIVVLLYTLAAYRPRRVSLTGLAVCLAGAGVAIARWSYAQSTTFLLLAVAAVGATLLAAWVLGDSAGYRRAYYTSLEERLVAAERTQDLRAKRARAVEEFAAILRRIERDLHDGAQVRLTALAMTLGEIRENLAERGDDEATLKLAVTAHQNAKDTLAELRDLARGIHPPVLDRGLEPALSVLAGTSAIPVTLNVAITARPSPAIEAIAYYCAAELLANAAKHSAASRVCLSVRERDSGLALAVTDDGRGGAHLAPGGGLAGLAERVQTVDGRLELASPPGGPTSITIELPGLARCVSS